MEKITVNKIISEKPIYNKNNPFHARVLERRTLTKPGSNKETQHFVIDLTGSGLTYTCGDSIGVYPKHCSSDVNALLQALQLTGDEMVTLPKTEDAITFREALTERLALSQFTPKILKCFLAHATDPKEKAQLEHLTDPENLEEAKEYLSTRHLIDLIEAFPCTSISPQDWASELRKLVPRLYSIASSPSMHPNHIHTTVAVVRYETHGRQRKGVATTYLADRTELNQPNLPIFVAKSPFALPEDNSKDILMVGPGTGVAPFRSFLYERKARQATGRNWLFFGEQHQATDFLYEDEWTVLLEEGTLTRLDTAFSRDQEQKIYVQQRLLENASEVWQWLENGAHFYICGDKRMGADVDAAILKITQEQGLLSEEVAKDYIKQMKRAKRYQRDVY